LQGAVDGRGRALGNLGLGLPGGALLPGDPAAAARLLLPSGVLVAQPSWVDVSNGTDSDYSKGTRFPLFGAGFPAFGGMFSVHFSSVLDQTFRGVRDTELMLGGETVIARDLFEQKGSVSALTVGFARMLMEQVSVGVSVGRYTGKLDRLLVRSTVSNQGPAVQPYVSQGSWSYAGYLVTAGLAARLVEIVNVSASATWSSQLDANATETTTGGDGSYDVPLQLRLGASAALAPGLLLVASATRADWSAVSDNLNGDEPTQAELAYGVGLELSRMRLLGRQAPLRLGFRQAALPFSPNSEDATEQAFSGGLGLTLSQTGEIILAAVDLAVERGTRSAGDLEEQFWRGTLSMQLSGL